MKEHRHRSESFHDAFDDLFKHVGQNEEENVVHVERHDLGGELSELMMSPGSWIVLQPVSLDEANPEVNTEAGRDIHCLELDAPPTLEPVALEVPPPPKKKRGRPRKLVAKEVAKKPKKYQDTNHADKSVRNAINAKRNRDLAKQREDALRTENASLRHENSTLREEKVTLLAEKTVSDGMIAHLLKQNTDYVTRLINSGLHASPLVCDRSNLDNPGDLDNLKVTPMCDTFEIDGSSIFLQDLCDPLLDHGINLA
ncbi:uncharacterized protein LOC110857287 [Folsomia candida]|uniref:BZIP domain-containing protein n=1 Tax=Folsomia candida TaxID=158441 RepID=A0A226DLR6_FOLCA|nr:uncharacterized protein LOC110857287 [Folsomia candida]OXA45146.1 hypothetical protein Fcan01_20219 [Folsomia candida]